MSVYHHSLSEGAPSSSLSPAVIEEAEDEASADEEMIEIVEQMRQRSRKTPKRVTANTSNNNKEKQLSKYPSSTNSRKHDLTVPNSTATPTVPHLKSQKVV